jgi:hypothetical protein
MCLSRRNTRSNILPTYVYVNIKGMSTFESIKRTMLWETLAIDKAKCLSNVNKL